MPTAVISGFAPGDTLAFIGLGQILTLRQRYRCYASPE